MLFNCLQAILFIIFNLHCVISVNIGEPALPALIKVIEEEKANSIRSQNALYAIQQIFRGDSLKGVLYLEKAMTESKSINGSKRLQFAARKTKEKWDDYQKLLRN